MCFFSGESRQDEGRPEQVWAPVQTRPRLEAAGNAPETTDAGTVSDAAERV